MYYIQILQADNMIRLLANGQVLSLESGAEG